MDAVREKTDSVVAGHSASGEDMYATKHRSIGAPAAPATVLLETLSAPVKMGRYQILRVLGEGAMGSVYLAHDSQLDRSVALKVPKFHENDRDTVKRFEREVRAMAALRHPNLCPAFDVGEIDGTHYFTMAYIEGKTLATHLASRRSTPVRQVALIIWKLAMALDTAHQADIVHRDLKPANIIIDQQNEPVLMDFGLACPIESDSQLTNEGLLVGTPAYMSPEQVVGASANVGPQSDLYGLGAIMYEMLTGRLPFDGHVGEVLEQVLYDEPPPPGLFNDELDAEFEAICLKLLAKKPADRFGSAAALARTLHQYLLANPRRAAASEQSSASISGATDRQFAEMVDQIQQLRRSPKDTDTMAIVAELRAAQDPKTRRFAQWASRIVERIKAKKQERRSSWIGFDETGVEQPADLGECLVSTRKGPICLPGPPSLRQQRRSRRRTWLIAGLALSVAFNLCLATAFMGRQLTADSTAAEPSPASAPSTATPVAFTPETGGDELSKVSAPQPVVSQPAATVIVADEPAAESEPEPSTAIEVADSETESAVQTVVKLAVADRDPVVAATKDRVVASDPEATFEPYRAAPFASEKPATARRVKDRAAGKPGEAAQRVKLDPARVRANDALPPHPPIPLPTDGLFAAFDRDRDGQISPHEVGPMDQAQFRRADIDRDSRLSREEVMQFFMTRPLPPPPPPFGPPHGRR
ncbi:MAG: protein kinase [Pirellulaceae bacterium]|nr:protein kinase [Pirellulaceae bacterium]